MKKILSLLGLLALTTTASASVVACDTHVTNEFQNTETILQDGNLVAIGNLENLKSDKDIVDTIKTAIVNRLQDHDAKFDELTVDQFDISITNIPVDDKLPAVLVNHDHINADTKLIFIKIIKENVDKLTFTLFGEHNGTITFANKLIIRDYEDKTPEAILNEHNTAESPIHIFETINSPETFKEAFWNGVIGQPRNYESNKDNFTVTVSGDDLTKLENLTTDATDVTVTFTIEKDFKVTQNAYQYHKDDTKTEKVYFALPATK